MVSKKQKSALMELSARQRAMTSPDADMQALRICKKLLDGSANILLGQHHPDVLMPEEIAYFLMALRHCKKSELSSVVEKGLQRLAIDRVPTRGGRPRGSRIEQEYKTYYEEAKHWDEELGMWKSKLGFERHSRRPDLMSRELSAKLKLGPETIMLLTTSKTPRSFYVKLVARVSTSVSMQLIG